jgi:2-oxo-4-hydroxy-4-carboxy-5-ureidoimidazoline decarboxylase
MKLTKNINLLKKKEFLSIFGNIFEKSDWIADEVFNLKPFKDSNDLVIKMMNIYENSNNEKIIKIFNLHPELAIEKNLTSFSSKEQTGAKLNDCSKEEFEEFEKLNTDYKKKYGFPFIIAVKGKNKEEILNNFRQRIQNDFEIEFNEAKYQVKKIASLRLEGILK